MVVVGGDFIFNSTQENILLNCSIQPYFNRFNPWSAFSVSHFCSFLADCISFLADFISFLADFSSFLDDFGSFFSSFASVANFWSWINFQQSWQIQIINLAEQSLMRPMYVIRSSAPRYFTVQLNLTKLDGSWTK